MCHGLLKRLSSLQDENGLNKTIAHIKVTEMRAHPIYSYYANWSQSLVLGFFPAVLLMYFNTKIYLDVRYVNILHALIPRSSPLNVKLNFRERERRKRPQNQVGGGAALLQDQGNAGGT